MKLLLSILLLTFSASAYPQSQTWGKSGKVIYPNAFPSTFRIDGGGTNSLTVNNTNAAGTTIARFQQQGTNAVTISKTELAGATFSIDYSDPNGVSFFGGSFLLSGVSGDGNPGYVFDTSIPHTSGNLLEVKNNGTNKFTLAYNGDMSSDGWGLGTDTPSTGSLVLGYTALSPGTSDGNTPYYMDTSITHASGRLLEIANNSTNKFTVSFDGAITTGDSGGGAGAWKLGTRVTGVSVALVITNYVEVNINGTVVKLAIVQ